METRTAVTSTIIENKDSVESANKLLHQYNQYTIGRTGLPYARREANIISVAMDTPQDIISTPSGGLGRLQGINSEAPYSNIGS